MQKKILFSILLLCGFQNIFSQANTSESLLKWLDSEIGQNNLIINNGRLFNDSYRTDKKTNRYLYDEKFNVGEVEYNNQYYPSVCINYDLLEDALLIKPYCEEDKNSLIVIKEKNKSFVLKGKKFVNLNYNNSDTNKNFNGYYEELISNNKIKVYTKYKKSKREKYLQNMIFYDYELRNEFCLFYKNAFHKIDSKSSITQLFPGNKTQINNFYKKNSQLEEENKVIFIKNLFNYINESL